MSDDIVDVWRKFYIRTWTDKKVMALSRPPPNGQTLLTWLIAGRQTGIVPGLFEIGERAFAELLGWPLHAGESLLERFPEGLPKGFREAFEEVSAQGFAKADWNARLVYVPGGLKLDPPANPNMILKWRKAWRELPECALKDEAEQAFKLFFEGYSKGFQEAFARVCGNGIRNQDSGFRKQDSGGGKRAKTREEPPRPGPKTLKEAQATTVPDADARALVEHWWSCSGRAASITGMPPVLVEQAKLILANAGRDLELAKRVVTAFCESDHKFWADRKWALGLLVGGDDFGHALALADEGGRTPVVAGRPVPKNDFMAEAAAKRAEFDRELAAENAARATQTTGGAT